MPPRAAPASVRTRSSRRAIQLNPGYATARQWSGEFLSQKGEYERAITELERARALSGADPGSTSALGYAYGVAGEREKALRLLDELNERSKGHYVSPFNIAVVYMGPGEKEQAFEWLRKACEERAGDSGTVNRDPAFDGLRADSRFAALAQCIAGSL
ncbi:MAG: hypothetical protein ABI682_09610 [Acidobacteriota bacterium]